MMINCIFDLFTLQDFLRPNTVQIIHTISMNNLYLFGIISVFTFPFLSGIMLALDERDT